MSTCQPRFIIQIKSLSLDKPNKFTVKFDYHAVLTHANAYFLLKNKFTKQLFTLFVKLELRALPWINKTTNILHKSRNIQ
jgi:hypothetical protein